MDWAVTFRRRALTPFRLRAAAGEPVRSLLDFTTPVHTELLQITITVEFADESL